MKTKTSAMAIPVLTAAFALAGCDYSPNENITNDYAKKLLLNADNSEELVGRYHIIKNEYGDELGVIVIQSVENNDSHQECIEYQAFSSAYPESFLRSTESYTRTTCIDLRNHPSP